MTTAIQERARQEIQRRKGLPLTAAAKVDLRPLADRLIVTPVKAPEKSEGGLYIPLGSQEKPQRGMVLAVGPGRTTDQGALIPMALKAGDEVLFGKYSGSEIEVDGEPVLIIREADVLAKVCS